MIRPTPLPPGTPGLPRCRPRCRVGHPAGAAAPTRRFAGPRDGVPLPLGAPGLPAPRARSAAPGAT